MSEAEEELYLALCYIDRHIRAMTAPEERKSYQRTALSFAERWKAALHLSPVRLVYAVRVTTLLSLTVFLVQTLGLAHGKWLAFTVASVSLPYADDVGKKGVQRLLATVVGGALSLILYALIPWPLGRTAVMMLSGYLTFYFSKYVGTFTCSTLGALGGAVAAGAFGWGGVGWTVLIRLEYVAAGIAVAVLCNCVLFPFTRRCATAQLWKKYLRTTDLLAQICRSGSADKQLYYSLVLQAHMQEEKLWQNAAGRAEAQMSRLLEQCRAKVRAAHRTRNGASLGTAAAGAT